VALLTALTVVRHGVWQTPESLWRDALAKSPEKSRPYVNVGMVAHSDGNLDEAIRDYCKALEIDPDHPGANDLLLAALIEKSEAGEGRMKVSGVEDDGSFVLRVRNPCRSATSGEP
jgi:Tfp pilus assembly protein PilF